MNLFMQKYLKLEEIYAWTCCIQYPLILNKDIFCFVERYRLQCDKFEAMWLMVKELSGRLNSHFNRSKNDNFALYFASQLPLQEYFDLIDAHFEVSKNLLLFSWFE